MNNEVFKIVVKGKDGIKKVHAIVPTYESAKKMAEVLIEKDNVVLVEIVTAGEDSIVTRLYQ